MNEQKIISKLSNSKLFSFDNQDYTTRLIKFFKENKKTKIQLENGDISLLFSLSNTNVIRNFFSDAQADGNIWYGTEELAKFALVPYDPDDNIDSICCVFMCKLKRLFD